MDDPSTTAPLGRPSGPRALASVWRVAEVLVMPGTSAHRGLSHVRPPSAPFHIGGRQVHVAHYCDGLDAVHEGDCNRVHASCMGRGVKPQCYRVTGGRLEGECGEDRHLLYDEVLLAVGISYGHRNPAREVV